MAVQPALPPDVIAYPTKKLFTVDEYYELEEKGILHPGERTELIEGEIILMPPIGISHANSVNTLAELLILKFSSIARVSIQNPVRIPNYNEPQPDFALIKKDSQKYTTQHPLPDDVFLLIEVSGTSLKYDRNTKLPIYAKAGIPEVWIIDIENSTLEKYTQPSGNQYQSKTVYQKEDTLHINTFPDIQIEVNKILPEISTNTNEKE